MAIEWTIEDQRAATAEGWDIFDCDGSASGPWQIQKFDDPEDGVVALADDTDAWVIVRDTPSALHARALAFIAEHNPQEYDAIMRWKG